MTFDLHHGDCLEVLKTLADNSVDSIVTDPPYGLAFMGKKWDYDVPKVDVWEECLRVLKPGGHALIACGTRTQHRMTVNVEDAGFEIRDVVAWIYGSGFPKSLNVSKAIDKINGRDNALSAFCAYVRDCRDAQAVSNKDIDAHLGLNSNGATAAHYTALDTQQQRFPRLEFYPMLKGYLRMDDRFDEDIKAAERQSVGKHSAPAKSIYSQGLAPKPQNVDITIAATDAAKQWDGFGTALKPAMELWTLARKPLGKGMTVAQNVLASGTGALNIDGCRVATNGEDRAARYNGNPPLGEGDNIKFGKREDVWDAPNGRFPANVIHDGSDVVLAGFPATTSVGHTPSSRGVGGLSTNGHSGQSDISESHFDTGSASRFFYCAKASKSDREEGCDDLDIREVNRYGEQGQGPTAQQTPRVTQENRNHHPTVKPTALMRYLCRLITPPNGTVLDPFTGSGSTGKAALLEGFEFIGIERESEYIDIARARIESVINREPLFATA